MIPDPTPPPPAAAPDSAADDVLRAQRGDMAAFERLYRANVGRVNALALRLTGDSARADDLMQSAFVRAWERLEQFRGESLFSTWLHRLTVNLFLVTERGETRRGRREEPTEDLDAIGAPQFGASDVGHRIDLERAIAALPTGARIAFVLHDIEGYKHDEIAAMHGIAAATVRAQLHRARRLLMEALDR